MVVARLLLDAGEERDREAARDPAQAVAEREVENLVQVEQERFEARCCKLKEREQARRPHVQVAPQAGHPNRAEDLAVHLEALLVYAVGKGRVEPLREALGDLQLERDVGERRRGGLERLEQAREEGNKVGPFGDRIKCREAALDRLGEAAVARVGREERGGRGWACGSEA